MTALKLIFHNHPQTLTLLINLVEINVENRKLIAEALVPTQSDDLHECMLIF